MLICCILVGIAMSLWGVAEFIAYSLTSCDTIMNNEGSNTGFFVVLFYCMAAFTMFVVYFLVITKSY